MALLASVLLSAASLASPACAPLAGAGAVLADPARRIIVVGEIHGTTEMPAAFADLVCAATQDQRPVVVALEYPVNDQPLLDAYLASDGGKDARERLFKSWFWQGASDGAKKWFDGRSSLAYLAMLDRLRAWKQAGAIAQVVAFQPVTALPGDAYETAMAQTVMAAAKPGTRVVVLVGNIHALRHRYKGFENRPSYMPMAGHLPPRQTLTVNIAYPGGAAWGCQGASAAEMVCGPHNTPVKPDLPKRGVALTHGLHAPYGATLNLGGPVTASMPAAN